MYNLLNSLVKTSKQLTATAVKTKNCSVFKITDRNILFIRSNKKIQ